MGNWTIKPANGAPCRLNLTSVPTLDLYKASISSCSSNALQNVNSWNIRNGNIVLYARGSVVARMNTEGAPLKGMLEGSSIPLTLSR